MNEPIEKILYVDDEELNCIVFERSFRKHFHVIVAKSGPEALDLLDAHQDIQKVVTDIKMPRMKGFEFLEAARSRHHNKTYFMLSGFDKMPEADSLLESGELTAYFQKPFDRAEILNHLMDA